MIRAVLFDFDLTLADSTRGAVECVNYALKKSGLESANEDKIRETIGLSLPRTFNALTGISDEETETRFSRWFVERADQVMADLTEVFPQVPGMLADLRQCGFKTAIVSTKYRYRIESILARAGLDGGFDAIVGGEDVSHHKPHPEGLRRALDKLEVRAREAVYVGDHPVDAEAAMKADLRFVAVLSGNATESDFDEHRVSWMVSSLEEIRELLR